MTSTELSEAYVNRLKVQLARMEKEMDELKDLIYTMQEAIYDEQDEYWDKVFTKIQNEKYSLTY